MSNTIKNNPSTSSGGKVRFRYPSVLCTATLIVAATYINAQGAWTQKTDFGGIGRYCATGFSIGAKGYIGTGIGSTYYKDFWEYDPTSDIWTQKADFGGTARYAAVGFSIGTKGYIGTGYGSSTYSKDFWEYDPSSNTWTQKASFGGAERCGATGFSIDTKGYIGTGNNTVSGFFKDFWEYDPSDDTWTKKADFGGTERAYATSFFIGTKGYIGTGMDVSNSKTKDFWEYDPSGNTWTQKADFGGIGRYCATGFSIGTKGYIGTGSGGSGNINDFWEYDPSGNTWTQKADFGGTARYAVIGFSNGTKGYIGTGYDGSSLKKDFWEYDLGGTQVLSSTVSKKDICFGNVNTGSATVSPVFGNPPYSFLWQPGGQTTASISGLSAGTYTVIVTDTANAQLESTITISALALLAVKVSGNITICEGSVTGLTASGGTNYFWIPTVGLSNANIYNPVASPATTTTYSVTVTDANGCNNNSSVSVSVNPLPAVPVISLSGSNLVSSSADSYQWYLNGSVISSATSQTYTPVQNGNYTIKITDTYGCSSISMAYTVTGVGITQPVLSEVEGGVRLFPNPSNGQINLLFGNKINNATVKLMNLIGQTVMEKTNLTGDSFSFDVSGYANGIYLVEIKEAESISRIKLVKN